MRTTLLLWLMLWLGAAQAHKPSDSYLNLDLQAERIVGQWDIALRDLDFALGLDGDDDGALTWGEVRGKQAEITAYVLARLSLATDDSVCAIKPEDLLIDEHTDGRYAVLRFSAPCSTRPSSLRVNYDLFADLDPQHRGLLNLRFGGATQTAVLAPGNGARRFELVDRLGPLGQLTDYLREGVIHIWQGYDHILFLVSLLLPSVLVLDRKRWRPAPRFNGSLSDAAWVVTAFTLAHSLTLSLAALGYVDLPSRWVESAIAASVIAAALNNLFPWLHHRRASLAFGFGLVHGLGFASVLSDLGLPGGSRLVCLLGFNLGVEVGQLAIVAGFLPLAFGLRRFRVYEWTLLKVGSSAIALVALKWLIERIDDRVLNTYLGL